MRRGLLHMVSRCAQACSCESIKEPLPVAAAAGLVVKPRAKRAVKKSKAKRSKKSA